MLNAVHIKTIVTRAANVLRLRQFFLLPVGYQREICSVLVLGGVGFLITALASFSPFDPSSIAASFPPIKSSNLAGLIGAELAGSIIYFIGIVGWLLPLPALTSLWRILRNSTNTTNKVHLFGWALAILCLTWIAALYYPTFAVQGIVFQSGGIVGSWLKSHLSELLGPIGSLIALGTLLISSLLFISRRSLVTTLFKMLKPVIAWFGQASLLPRFKWPKFSRNEKQIPVQAQADDSPNRIPEVGIFTGPLIERVTENLTEVSSPSDSELGSEDDEGEIEDNILVKSPPSKLGMERRPIAPYVPPPLAIFNTSDPAKSGAMTPTELEATAQLLVKTFEDFGVFGKIVGNQPGPVVTVFEYQPNAGVKQSKIIGLIDDLALALKVDSIFIHPVRGKRALGVQVPNPKRDAVFFGDIVSTPTFLEADSPLTFNMGKTISGQPMCADLAAMPHLLVAGATGSGKSVAINALICSIIMKAPPEEVRMILVDPKMLELSVYEGIPHLLMPVITDPIKASLALKWATEEMERRYRLMQTACVRHISGFNQFWAKASESKRDELRDIAGDANIGPLPYLLLVIDELADLMMTAPKDVEASIQRLAQKARASGIHMVLATQRPSVDIITGVIKANLPCRIAFQVVSKHDSRTILDLIGAEKLLGRGDMLLQRPGVGRLERIQGALITDEEVLSLVASVKASSTPRYDDSIMSWIEDEVARQRDKIKDGAGEQIAMDDDPKWDEAINIARTHGVVSASFLQRHLKIGYNRAARIVEFMESRGMVDKADGAKPRKWLGA